MPEPLPPSFYERDTLLVARELIGCEIVHEDVRVRITEVEAYCFPGDSANHARAGRTARNAPMWGPPGRAYVYLCYGLHAMLNLVTGPEGHPAAVLIRAAEPVAGLERIVERRKRQGPEMLAGPGRVGQALGLTTAHSGQPLQGDLAVYARAHTPLLLAGPRVGIDYADERDRLAPWRFAAAGTRWVSKARLLKPMT